MRIEPSWRLVALALCLCVVCLPSAASRKSNDSQSRGRPTTTAPDRAAITACLGPPVTGNCRAAIPRWFFNQTASECQQFTYGGCGGNDNRHDSKDSCLEACGRLIRDGTRGRNRRPRPTRTPETNGTTRHHTHRPRKASRTTPLPPTTASPHGGRQRPQQSTTAASWLEAGGQETSVGHRRHRRTTRTPFIRTTSPAAAAAASEASRGNNEACTADPEVGAIRCMAYIPMWFHNRTTGKCQEFVYGGCRGTANRYETEQACELACHGGGGSAGPASTASMAGGMTGTDRPVTRRPHRARMTTPATFHVVLTGGESPASEMLVATRPSACRGPAVQGRCKGAFPKWFFNESTGQCQRFTYGGCGGSENQHDSQEACERTCRG